MTDNNPGQFRALLNTPALKVLLTSGMPRRNPNVHRSTRELFLYPRTLLTGRAAADDKKSHKNDIIMVMNDIEGIASRCRGAQRPPLRMKKTGSDAGGSSIRRQKPPKSVNEHHHKKEKIAHQQSEVTEIRWRLSLA
jgi:hypothetical protein